jgi:protein-arginine kinase activator protein McsA
VAISTCPHCQNNSFELHEGEISGAKYRLLFVQCTKCGAPFGTRESYDYRALLQEQEARIKNIEHQILSVLSHLSHIGRIVAALANQRTI